MVSAHDVAAYMLRKHGPMSAMKLQKLVYYAQAWSLVWEDRPLFPERIEAWANGPVIPELYQAQTGVTTSRPGPRLRTQVKRRRAGRRQACRARTHCGHSRSSTSMARLRGRRWEVRGSARCWSG